MYTTFYRKIIEWIQFYLIGRQFLVKVNDGYLKWYVVICGVPEESVLRPMFFVLYINDLVEANNEDGKTLLLAVNLKIYSSITCYESCNLIQ